MQIKRHYNTLYEAVKDTAYNPEASRSRASNHSGAWTMGLDFDEAVKLAVEGWTEGAENIKKISDVFRDSSGDRFKKEIVYDVQGGNCMDIGRAIAGLPECFMVWQDSTEHESVTTGSIISIIVNICYAWNINAKDIMARGQYIVALVDCLETAGFQTEIRAQVITTSKQKDVLQQTYTLKKAGDVLDLAQVAFALAHPAFLRRINFANTEQLNKKTRERFSITQNGNYGLSNKGETQRKENEIELAAEVFANDSEATKWLTDTLSSFGMFSK